MNNKYGSTVVITVSRKSEAKELTASHLWFGKAIKKVEKNWNIDPKLVYLMCCEIRYKYQNKYRDSPKKYTICTGVYQVSKH